MFTVTAAGARGDSSGIEGGVATQFGDLCGDDLLGDVYFKDVWLNEYFDVLTNTSWLASCVHELLGSSTSEDTLTYLPSDATEYTAFDGHDSRNSFQSDDDILMSARNVTAATDIDDIESPVVVGDDDELVHPRAEHRSLFLHDQLLCSNDADVDHICKVVFRENNDELTKEVLISITRQLIELLCTRDGEKGDDKTNQDRGAPSYNTASKKPRLHDDDDDAYEKQKSAKTKKGDETKSAGAKEVDASRGRGKKKKKTSKKGKEPVSEHEGKKGNQIDAEQFATTASICAMTLQLKAVIINELTTTGAPVSLAEKIVVKRCIPKHTPATLIEYAYEAITAADKALKSVKTIIAKSADSPYPILSTDVSGASGIPNALDYATVITSTRLHIFDNTKAALTRALKQVTKPLPLTMAQLAGLHDNRDASDASDGASDERTNSNAEEQNDFFTKVFLPYYDEELQENTDSNTYALREWLCHNYLLPHPTRKNKEELASDNNMEVRQVTDWFTNMRSRVWKPSIEQLMDELLIDKRISEAMKIQTTSKAKEASTSARKQ